MFEQLVDSQADGVAVEDVQGRLVYVNRAFAKMVGQDGKELFRTAIEEPVHVRPDVHANSI